MGGTLGGTNGFLPLQRPRDSPLCVSGVRQPTVQCLRLAGLKRPAISDHALRHAAAPLGYLDTGDLRAVQDFPGHADPRMTARYAHVVDMAKRNPALFIPIKIGWAILVQLPSSCGKL
jgi:integrase